MKTREREANCQITLKPTQSSSEEFMQYETQLVSCHKIIFLCLSNTLINYRINRSFSRKFLKIFK